MDLIRLRMRRATGRSHAVVPGLRSCGIALAGAAVVWMAVVGPARAEVEEVEVYASLPELTRAADAVVLGQVVAATEGRSFGGCGNTAATLRVDGVVAGRIPALAPILTVEYFGWCAAELPRLGREIPAERGVFFLRNKGAELRAINPGASEAEVAADVPFWRLAILAGSAFDRGGRVHVPETLNADFLAAFEGKAFADLITAIRTAAPRPPAPSAGPPASSPGLLSAGLLIVLGAGAVGVVVAWRRVRPTTSLPARIDPCP